MPRPFVRAGSFRRKIILQKNASTQDTFGDLVESWKSLLITKASISPSRGMERFTRFDDGSFITHIVHMRMPNEDTVDVTGALRLISDSSAPEVESILDIKDEDAHTLFGSRVLELISVEDINSIEHFLDFNVLKIANG